MRFLKSIGLVVILVMLCLFAGILTFISLAPQFGKPPSGEDLVSISASPNYTNGQFVNLVETSMDFDVSDMPGLLYSFIFPPEGKNPIKPIPTQWETEITYDNDSLAKLTWFGHSAVMLEIDGKTILIDPMLGPASAPVSFLTKRFDYEEPIKIANLPHIDAIIISHDHYDHLDYVSILELKEKTDHFFTALGVGSHLEHWGVSREQITELDWWEQFEYRGLSFSAAPARHFSGRGILDRNKTQWASWAVKGTRQNIYFSGDGGYGPHFKEIGKRLGPFDLAMVECGQYNELWKAIHMMPEESVQAGIDVRGEVLMPIHWGAFDLAPHVWQDPIVRFTDEAKKLKVDYVTPIIGDRFTIGLDNPRPTWWLN